MSTRRPSWRASEVVIITGDDLEEYLSEKGQIKKACDLYNWDVRQLVAVVSIRSKNFLGNVLILYMLISKGEAHMFSRD
jgi:hypothetical protein